jgi:hypothetical protein
VDARGGALSVLAASVAKALGVDAVAATCVKPTESPPELAMVLDEVGMGVPVGAATPWGSVARADDDVVVFLGASPPPELAGEAALDVALFDGAGELERLALARIARDTIERKLEAIKSSHKA